MWIFSAVEENQMPRLRAEDRTPAVDLGHACGSSVMRDYQFAAFIQTMIGKKEQGRKRIRINVAFETHLCSLLHVENDSVALIACRHDRAGPDTVCQLKETRTVEPMEPGESLLYLMGMNPPTRDALHVGGLTRYDWSPREVSKVGASCRFVDIHLPVMWKHSTDIECRPLERGHHYPVLSLCDEALQQSVAWRGVAWRGVAWILCIRPARRDSQAC